ncbi:hypothetical protein [Halopelagius longus]|uniref:DUF3054 domain-containing protein n=1 Tax=Halopelagius longus TaxID=1236180 RepID=A0A1H0Y1R4_9EURY|nr:hypothetical protein [Halopelagius longus]RDI72229.1 hypothetical protein DWB78_11190 [Halopelagius longus]SDQ09088.1 hypothetical protein SAMN05216278_0346 [Halopelagius longus]
MGTLRSPVSVSASGRWSAYAGLYTFAFATATALLLDQILSLFAAIVGIPTELWAATFATPTLVVGPVVWWVVVERRESYAYRFGGAFGLLTALLTGLVWTLRFVSVWGVEMVTVGYVPLLVAVLFGVAAVAGTLAGVPLMYARRRSNAGPPDESDP